MAVNPNAAGGLAKHGLRLLERGYEIIPIQRGSKRPPDGLKNWQELRATPDDVDLWTSDYARAGVGILTRKTPGVDLDLLDEKMAAAMQAFVEENFGFAPVRIGMAPKRLLMFQADAPFPKVQSKTWIDPFGDPSISTTQSGEPNGDWRKVEILGDGQQFVAYALHPDTGRPYEWTNFSQSPVHLRHDDLPVLDQAGAEAIVAEFERLAEKAKWTLKPGTAALKRMAPGSRIAHDDVFAADKAKTDISEDELHRKLMLVPGADDHDVWFQVGMALYHQFDGDDRGLELWHEWSSTSSKYNSEDLDYRWTTFDITDKQREPVTARLIIKLADEKVREIAVETFREIKEEFELVEDIESLKTLCDRVKTIEFDTLQRTQIVYWVITRFKKITKATLGVVQARSMVRYENPKPRDIPHWLEGWLYVSKDKEFYSTTKHYSITREAFDASYGRFMLTKKDILEGKTAPENSASSFALNNKQITVVMRRMYMPGEDETFGYNGNPYVNSYNGNNVPTVPDQLNKNERAAVEMAKGHLKHLFANDHDRGVLIDCLAFLVQNPTERINFGIVMQGVQQDGKTWFAGLLAAVLGPENINNLTAEALEEKFTPWAEGVRVNFFEEVKLQGHNRFDVLNKVKPKITNLMVSVRRMNTDVYQAVNTVTYFFTTNYRDALPLDDTDSRYFILTSRFQTKSALASFKASDPKYYARLYAALQHPGALRGWLLAHKVSPGFDHKDRAPDSAGRREMISLARSDVEEVLNEIMQVSTDPSLSTYVFDSLKFAEKIGEEGLDVPYGRQMAALMTKHGFTRLGKVRIGDRTPVIYSQFPERFMDASGTSPNVARILGWIAAVI